MLIIKNARRVLEERPEFFCLQGLEIKLSIRDIKSFPSSLRAVVLPNLDDLGVSSSLTGS